MINDTQILDGAYTIGGLGDRYPLKVYDDGFGPLWVYGEVYGPMGVVRAQTYEDAYEIVQDEIMTRVSEEDLLEAYGLYVMEHKGSFYLCPDFYTDDSQYMTFDNGIPGRRVLGVYPTRESAESAGRAYIGEQPLDIVEGYEYQSNATGTGIVTFDLNGQDLRILSNDVADRMNLKIQVSEG